MPEPARAIAEHQDVVAEAGEQREDAPDQRRRLSGDRAPGCGGRPDWAIGTCRSSAPTAHDGDQGEDAREVEAEVVADLGQQDAEGGAVELVDHVEAEQDEQGVDRAVAGQLVEGPPRVADRSWPRPGSTDPTAVRAGSRVGLDRSASRHPAARRR